MVAPTPAAPGRSCDRRKAMTPDRYEASLAGPRRLTGRTERRGSQTGFSTAGAIAFGGAFVAVGVGIMLVGLRVIPVDPKGVHAPYWILTVMGAVFASAGVWVWTMAARQFAANRRREDALLRYAGEPALADYAWDPQGLASKRWSLAARALAGAGLIALFISIFNWWAFFTDSPWVVKAVTVIFDVVLLAVWWQTVVIVGRALKFGASRLLFARFPYRIDEPIDIAWQPASGIGRANGGSFTLRCVKEWFEVTGSGSNQTRKLVHEEQWSGAWLLDHAHEFSPGEQVDLRFRPPGGLPATQLAADLPVFWEFEVNLDLPGFDFEETYLVPVYAGR
jgi:hypothetical protein